MKNIKDLKIHFQNKQYLSRHSASVLYLSLTMKLPPKKVELLLSKSPRRTNWHELYKYSPILDRKNSVRQHFKIQRISKGLSRRNRKNKQKSASDRDNKRSRGKINLNILRDRIGRSEIKYPQAVCCCPCELMQYRIDVFVTESSPIISQRSNEQQSMIKSNGRQSAGVQFQSNEIGQDRIGQVKTRLDSKRAKV